MASTTSDGVEIASASRFGLDTERSREPDVRDSMLSLPGFLQLPLTFLTGKPHSGQKPMRIAPSVHLIGPCFTASVGLFIGMIALREAGWMLLGLLPSWILVLHGMRNFRMMVFHQCAHRNMWRRSPRLEVIVGDLVAGLLIVQSFNKYSSSHRQEHHGFQLMTVRDPTVYDFLVLLGLRPRMTRPEMWSCILRAIFSPVFHARFFWSRLRSSVMHGSALQCSVTIGVPIVFALWGLADIIALLGYLLLWLLPLTGFFQISTVLRLCVKHTFPSPGPENRNRASMAALTGGVFLGDPLPLKEASRARNAAVYMKWIVRLLAIHLPSRYLVLTGDAVCHDYHHRHPRSRDWPNYIFARQADQDAGHPGWPPYEEVWGLIPAIDRVLESIRNADPDTYDPKKLVALPRNDAYNSFDD